MGLPLFIAPKEAHSAIKSPEKMVAIPRSAIRRRSVPRPRHTSSSLRRRLLGSLEQSREEAFQIWESQNRHTASGPDNGLAGSLNARPRRGHEGLRSRRSESPTTTHDVLDYVQREGLTMPAVPEADLFSHGHERPRNAQRERQALRDQSRRMARRHAAPTPPYFDQDTDSVGYPFIPASQTPPSMTPAWTSASFGDGISPSSPALETRDSQSFSSRMQEIQWRPSLNDRIQALSRGSNDLRRSHSQFQQTRVLRQSTFDGLGDRNRSLSPEHNTGAWDTLLTSITPDPQAPSAGSSFASASFATATSAATHTATPMVDASMTSLGDTQGSVNIDCDVSGDSNTEGDEEDIYGLHDFSRRERRESIGWRAVSSARLPDTINLRHSVTDPEHLGGMHRIISRLAERDEIPDEWWTSAGLSRNLRRDPLP